MVDLCNGRFLSAAKRILEHVQNQYDLSLSCARKEMRNHKENRSCNWIKWDRRGPTQCPHNGRLGARSFFTFVWLRSSWHRHMATKDYEGTAAVSNFQRYYYFNPLSPRQGAAPYPRRIAKIFSIAVISIAKAPFLASYDPSRCARYPPRWLWKMRYILRDAWRERSNRFHV